MASTSPCLGGETAGNAAGIAAFRGGRFAEAYQAWSAAAQAGDGRAARHLGVLYDTGEGVRQDRARAVQWYRRAAQLGDATGMFNVAVAYDSGIGVPKDRREAARWYRRAAARHDGRAEYDLGLMLERGDGVPRDPAGARTMFAAAEHDGITAAASHLPASAPAPPAPPAAPDPDAGFLQAQRALLSRRPDQMADAVTRFRRLAAAGGPSGAMARYDLAWCYENGAGVPADRAMAYTLYIQAAAETNDSGLRDLAENGALGLRP